MSGETYVLYCKAEDFDATAQTCSAPFYGPAPSFLPPLGVTDALVISASIAGCWGVGYMIKMARRASGG